MRQGQHNKRSRNRGRRQPNPSSRVLESNGPDVKVRGTASHIAEKYATLGRDAQAAGDIIAAENFFQHAEHYSRIVAAANAYMQQQQQPSGGSRHANGDGSGTDEEGDSVVAANGGDRYGRDHGHDGGDRDGAPQEDERREARSSDGHDGSGEGGEDGKDAKPAATRARKSSRASTTRRRRRSGGDSGNGSGETPASADSAEDSSRHDDSSTEDQVPAAG